VEISGSAPQSSSRSFQVTRSSQPLESALTREYRLRATSQAAYLDLFEALAVDFQMRMPSNRRSAEPSTFVAPLRPLLTKNISPDILYGYGDPAVLRVTDRHGDREALYYLVATSNDAPQSFPILCSRDLREWGLAGFVFPRGEKPPWAADNELRDYWAPELHRVGGQFVLCFAAREHDGAFAIGLAWSANPIGPFEPSEWPVIRNGVIDPHMFVDEDGSATLFWKEDSNDVWPSLLSSLLHDRPELIDRLLSSSEDRRTACFNALLWPWVQTLHPMERFFVQQVLIEAVVSDFSRFRFTLAQMVLGASDPAVRAELTRLLDAMRTVIYGQRLDTERWLLTDERSIVLENDLDWEGHLVEGVWVTKRQGRYYVFYSGNDFSTGQYGIGVGVADSSPLGPYTKFEQPFLRSTCDWSGPGHPSVADGTDGRPWLFLHAYRPGRAGYKQFRALLALPLTFSDGGVIADEGRRSFS